MIYDLPTSLEFGGREWPINTDFRVILSILTAFEDVELTDAEKGYVCLYNLYVDYDDIPHNLMQAAYDAAIEFIDHGHPDDNKPSRKTMDWVQDAPLIFPAVNHVAGFEVRSANYIHWWTFMGYFMEIKDSTYSTVLSLRQKKWVHHKKLEKYEQEYWKNNRAICELKRKETEDDKAEKAKYEAILGRRQ